MAFNLYMLIHVISAVIFLSLLIFVIVKRGLVNEQARHLNGLLLNYILLEVGLAIKFGGDFRINLLPDVLVLGWTGYGILLGSILIRQVISQITRRKTHYWWWLMGVGWFLLSIGVIFIPGFANITFWVAGWQIEFRTILASWLFLGWMLFTVLTIRLLFEGHQTTNFPTFRNRLFILGLSLGGVYVGNVFSLVGQEHIGTIMSALGMSVLTYVILTPRLPHLGIALRGLINKVMGLALEFLAYGVGFLFVQYLLAIWFKIDNLLVALGLSLLIIVVINPLLRRLRRWMDRWFFGKEQDLSSILSEYSQNISSILDMELLSAVAVDLVRDMLGVESGLLLLVELEVSTDGKKQFRIQQGRKRKDASLTGLMPAESALAQTWDKDRQPLTRDEIDMLPRYQSIQADTRRWLSRVGMDIFVPIHAQDEWVGLLALGPKASGASYFPKDIELLRTMADQTAVALQNTRLVESLMRVNTEFRRAYSAMDEALSKLQRIDRTKSDFISIASHELRTPLTVLSGYGQILMEAPDLKSNPDYSDALEGVLDGADRLHEIVESMLEVAKIDTRELDLSAESIKIELVISNVCRKFASISRERKIKILIDKNVSTLPLVRGDQEALKKVFRHLISNAVKFTPDEGMITISGRHLQKGFVKFPKGGVEIQIRDTGIGIDPRYKELIFTKFYQTGDIALHSSGKTKFKGGGPGLGLAIVRGIVLAHGGRVWAESPGYDENRNPGSSFFVILPLNEQPDGEIE